MRPSSILFVLLFTFILGKSNSQDKQNIEHKFLSEAFETERTVRVFLPERYFRDSTSTFIVVYVLDAHDDQVWNMVKGNIDYAVSRYAVIPMIAVGIASENRGSEFNPNSETLHKHFKEEVFPLIESKYRIKKHRTIIGHSWGGAFVGNTIFSDKSEMFDAYLAFSPSFAANNNVIFNQADSLLRLKKDFKKFLYYSSGSVGFEEGFKNNVAKMDSLLNTYNPKNLAYTSQFFDGKDHFSALRNDILIKFAFIRRYFIFQQGKKPACRQAGVDNVAHWRGFSTP